MCDFCVNGSRCVKCGDFIRESSMDFTESIEDLTILPQILAQKLVCNDCKLDQIKIADVSKLGFYKTFGLKTTAINN